MRGKVLSKVVPIKVADPLSNYLKYRNEIDRGIRKVVQSGQYILGNEVKAFEHEFSSYLGVEHCVGVGSGTDALVIGLRACGIGLGDIVFTVSHTAVATVAAIEMVGATPILVDIDPDTYTMDPNCLEEAISLVKMKANGLGNGLKAVIPVHLYGHPVDMVSIMEIAERHGFYVIEDCAQAHGASINKKKVGTWGHVSAFSFYPTKNLSALGDGGAIVTNDQELANRAQLLRQYGWQNRYVSQIPGFNSRLDEIQAAILRVKLKHLDEDNGRRQAVAEIYHQEFKGLELVLPTFTPKVEHVYHQYVVLTARRDSLRRHLAKDGVDTAIHYPVPVHLQPAYLDRVVIGSEGLPRTEALCRQIVSLPMHPHLELEQVQIVSEAVRSWASLTGWHCL